MRFSQPCCRSIMSSAMLSRVDITDVSKELRPFETSVSMGTEMVCTIGKVCGWTLIGSFTRVQLEWSQKPNYWWKYRRKHFLSFIIVTDYGKLRFVLVSLKNWNKLWVTSNCKERIILSIKCFTNNKIRNKYSIIETATAIQQWKFTRKARRC
jgi:hypothetical protein